MNTKTLKITPQFLSFALAAFLGAGLAIGGASLWRGAADGTFRPAEWIVESARADVGKGDYLFLPYRMTMWVVNRTNGKLIHYQFYDNQVGTVERTRVSQVDAKVFPLKDTEFFLSERNLSSFIWVVNRGTGDFQIWRANRDGSLSTDEQYVQSGEDLRATVFKPTPLRSDRRDAQPMPPVRRAAGISPEAPPPSPAPAPAPAPVPQKRPGTTPVD